MDSRIDRAARLFSGGAAIAVIAAIAVTAMMAATPLLAQQPGEVTRSGAMGIHSQSFTFADSADAQRATLLIIPFAWQERLSSRVALDGYTAYAHGAVRTAGETFRLSGPVDSWARLRWAVKSSAVVAVGINFPTGIERHTSEQAVVSTILSNDLLGFREGSWGAGTSGTFGFSTAKAVRGSNVTFGASYRTATSFRPSADTSSRFAPGSETRFRLGLDALVAGGRLESGLSYQNFAVDQYDSKNLFQAGPRYRADVTYRRGAFSLFAADLLRKQGELTVPVVNIFDGTFDRDTTMAVGWQNLAIVGLSAAMELSPRMAFQPSVELKLRTREDRAGRGWITGVGGVLPMIVGSTELFPSAKFTFGEMIPSGDPTVSRSLRGAEFSLIVRRASRAPAR